MIKNCFVVLFTLLGLHVIAQKSDLVQAEAFIESQQFQRALAIYESLPPSSNKQLRLEKAHCYIETDQVAKAQEIINSILAKKPSDTETLLAQAYLLQSRYKFKEAIDIYKSLLKKTKAKHKQLPLIRAHIKRCREAMKVKRSRELAFVENLGDVVNTFYDDYGALASPTVDGRFYFSSNRLSGGQSAQASPQSDLFIAQSENGILTTVNRFESTLNTSGDESILDFSPSGMQLLFYQKADQSSEASIRLKQFDQDDAIQSPPVDFNSKIKGNRGDNYVQIHSDTTFIYSSRRIEGKGGYDIYFLIFKDGHWREPINAGDQINSGVDEICPFLTSDGKQLFFSSNRHESIGGFDIFYSEYDEQSQQWNAAKNIGFPINSIKDDLYFKVADDGNAASFSSNRIGTLGGLDLYVAYLKTTNTHQVKSDGIIPFLKDHQQKNLLLTSAGNKFSKGSFDTATGLRPLETFQIKPLFFDAKDQIVFGRQSDYVEQIIRFLKSNPNYAIEIQSHTTNQGEPTFELYSSIKRTEEFVSVLVDHTIPAEQIITKGFGNYFPINHAFGANRINAAEQMGKRIHVFFRPMDENHTVKFVESNISKSIQSQAYKTYLQSLNGLTFSIQIAETKQLYTNADMSNYQFPKIEKIDNVLAYTVGMYKTFAQAKEALSAMEESEFQQVNIIAYINGKRLHPEKLSPQTEGNLELEEYLIYLRSKK